MIMHIRVNSLERDAVSAHIMLPKFPIGNPSIIYLSKLISSCFLLVLADSGLA